MPLSLSVPRLAVWPTVVPRWEESSPGGKVVAPGSVVGRAGGRVLAGMVVGEERTIIVGEGITGSVAVVSGVGEDRTIIVGLGMTALVDEGPPTAVAVSVCVEAAGVAVRALMAVGVKVNVEVAVTAFIAVGVKVKVGEAAVSMPDGSAVTVGGEVVLPPARAITSTSARAAALPLTELISTRTTLAVMSLKVTLVPLSESAPEVLLPTRFVPPVSLKSFTVAA